MISLWGFYKYDPTIFDNMEFIPEIDRSIVIRTILKDCGDLLPYNQQPVFLKEDFGIWSRRNYFNFKMLYDALYSEYSPIENYDRREDSTVKRDKRGNDQNVLNAGIGNDVTKDGFDTSANSGSITNERQVSAFDSSAYSNAEKNTTSPLDTNTVTYASGTHTQSKGKDTNTAYYNSGEDMKTVSRVHGNVGVTTNQTMINEELKLRTSTDLAKTIARLFEREFIYQIY